MVRYHFGPLDLGRVRLAISPLYEMQFSFEVLRDPAGENAHRPWARAARAALEGVDLALLDALVPSRGYVPDFLAPPPQQPVPDVTAELARVRATPPAQVQRELRTAFAGRRVPPAAHRLLRQADAARRIADLLAAYWERALATWWPRVRALAEAEITDRGRALAERGPLGLFAELHPDVAFRDGVIEIDRPFDAEVELGGRGLLLVPTAFTSRLGLIVDRAWQPTIVYPAAGSGTLWERGRGGPDRALAALLGQRRAEILVALRRPATTGDLAEALAASRAGVSEHLQVLRRAGLVSPHRDGHFVRYRRTSTGDALIATAAD